MNSCSDYYQISWLFLFDFESKAMRRRRRCRSSGGGGGSGDSSSSGTSFSAWKSAGTGGEEETRRDAAAGD
eukprot:m.121076 g.121076  ORF g.121076 m.121076 type:complete len:71 (-) comp23267_c0_seq1:3-215(-)